MNAKRKVAAAVAIPVALVVLLGLKLHARERALHEPASGSGTIEGTDLHLSSKVSARVVAVAARRGQPVEAGALLVTLDCTEPRAARIEAEARLRAARAQADASHAQAESAHRNQGALEASAAAARAQTASLTERRDAAARQASRLERLGDDATLSSRDQSRAEAEGLRHQALSSSAQGASLGAQARAAVSAWHAADAQAEAAERMVTAAESSIARADLMVAECEVRAPRAAIVDDVFVEIGEQALPGVTLVRLVDLTTVKATFYLPNAELSAARPAAPAIVEADAWPNQRFAGTVTTVSTTAEFTPRNIQTRTDRDRLVYAIEVRVPNPAGRLRPGMPVQVTLPGTER
jgi:HlyD family secretion protein